jgi:hypothetical protein
MPSVSADFTLEAHERRWPATVTVLAVLLMQFGLPLELGGFPRAVLPVVELGLLLPVVISNPVRLVRDYPWVRSLGVALSVLLAMANASTLVLLVVHVLLADSVGRMPPAALVRASRMPMVTSETADTRVMISLAGKDSGRVSVGLNAVAPVKATKR